MLYLLGEISKSHYQNIGMDLCYWNSQHLIHIVHCSKSEGDRRTVYVDQKSLGHTWRRNKKNA